MEPASPSACVCLSPSLSLCCPCCPMGCAKHAQGCICQGGIRQVQLLCLM
ncbi:unnamed protein product [Nyctereutes procyonoides]|uniref:Metallothionein n=1 Tax=Nyctereutes procyonoides TaxID=34880 RepID=A0A811Y0I7_NYCPR|nr:unnamed protein product [Nyctereutes procyonoides]